MDIQQQLNDLNARLDRFDDFLTEYYRNNNASSQTFTKKVYFKGGIDLSTGDYTIGGASSRVGFYGVTAVVRASAISAPSAAGATYDQTQAQTVVSAVNSIRLALSGIGITS
jgi:hypothetical protein